MPWYRIYADHGPGHQSSTEFYRWYSNPLDTKQKRKDAWEEWFDGSCGQYDYPIGDVELVDRLPQHVYDEKVKAAHDAVSHAHSMMDILRKTQTKPVIAVRLETFWAVSKATNPRTAGMVTGFQARLLAEPTVVGPLKKKRDEAVDALLSMFRRENRKIMKAKKGATRYSRKSDYAVISR
jgi:hypothetical protein